MRSLHKKPEALERVDRVGPLQDLGPGARNRFVVSPELIESQTPFVLLVEDFLQPGSDFHPHPHRGFETVTYILDGEMRHEDSVGNTGVAAAGDVLWMTAGSGIVHGGEPVGNRPVHALQLWTALPAALRNSPPGTRQQSSARALHHRSGGATARTYGAAAVQPGYPVWSRWPVTLTDVAVDAPGSHTLNFRPGERSFLYIVDGTLSLEGRPHKAGEVLWFRPLTSELSVELRSISGARVVHYSAPPIYEPIVARGPFVMGSDEEIREAFADQQAGRR